METEDKLAVLNELQLYELPLTDEDSDYLIELIKKDLAID